MTDKFVILRLINSGGQADVYLGELTENGERVAVKVLREPNIPAARKAFVREARILALKVSGLIPLLYSNMNAGRPYYVMPLMEGSLTPFAGKLTSAQLKRIATEVANTVAAVHATGDAHGDIKPDNILLSHIGELKVADPLGNGAHCTMRFAANRGGTPGYWAPEVRVGGPISPAADVFSYGATLYHLQTGRKPRDGQRFDISSAANIMAADIQQIIVACCQPDPRARPSMRQVLRILRGEQWSAIRAAQKQQMEFVTVVCVIGVIAAFGVALAG